MRELLSRVALFSAEEASLVFLASSGASTVILSGSMDRRPRRPRPRDDTLEVEESSSASMGVPSDFR